MMVVNNANKLTDALKLIPRKCEGCVFKFKWEEHLSWSGTRGNICGDPCFEKSDARARAKRNIELALMRDYYLWSHQGRLFE